MNFYKYISESRTAYEHYLRELVEIPSVSMEPERKGDIVRCANQASMFLFAGGFQTKVLETAGNPIVWGERIIDKKYPTVLLYNHLDVQPADPTEWKNPPFTFTANDGKYYGRGATDDKGPALALLFAALYATQEKIPLNFQIIWELEEEIGSPNFEELFWQNPFTVKPNSVLVSDGLWISKDQPSSEYGLRGIMTMSLVLETGEKDVHSGVVGGLARNPLGELCEVISGCCDAKTGQVIIPGFYEGVRPTSSEEVDNLLRIGFDQEVFKQEHGLNSIRRMPDKVAVQAIKTLPTFEVHGISGGYTGSGTKTIVPHRAEAKISLRIVPDQDPERIKQWVGNYIRILNRDVEVKFSETLLPYLSEPSGPYVSAVKKAVQIALGKECVFDRAGGSIGAVSSMVKHLGVPITFFGLSLPEHGYHAKNECFEWVQAEAGIKVFVEYFKEIVKVK